MSESKYPKLESNKPLNERRKLTHSEIQEAEHFFAEAVGKLYEVNPFYYYVLRQLDTKLSQNFPAHAGVGFNPIQRNIVLTFNTHAVYDALQYKKEGGLDDIVAVLEHECSHVSLNHIFYNYDYANDMKHDLLNIAEDLYINSTCDKMFNRFDTLMSKDYEGILKNICFFPLFKNPEKYPHLFEVTTPDGKTMKVEPTRFKVFAEKFKGKEVQDMDHLEIYDIIKAGVDKENDENFEKMLKQIAQNKDSHKVEQEKKPCKSCNGTGKKQPQQQGQNGQPQNQNQQGQNQQGQGQQGQGQQGQGQQGQGQQGQGQQGQGQQGQGQQGQGQQGQGQNGQGQQGQGQNGQGQNGQGQNGQGQNGQGQNGQGQQGHGQGNGHGQGQGEPCPCCQGTGEEQGGQGQGQQGQGQGQQGQGQGQLRQSDVDKALLDAVKDLTQDGNVSLGKAMGSLPADLLARIEKLLETTSNFKKMLNSFLASLKDNKKKRSWRKLNKRYPELAPAKQKQKRPSIVLGIDVSGSMWDPKVMEMIMYEVKMYSSVCNDVWIVAGDTRKTFEMKVKDEKHFKRLFDSGELNFGGGGGTNLQFVWDFAKEKKVDGVVCHTDGYIPDFDTHKIKTVFGIYPGGTKVEGKWRNEDIIPKGLLDI